MSEEKSNDIVQEVLDNNNNKMVQIVYLLYLASLVLGITGLIGVIIAYMNKGDAPAWAQSHYRFQIRTFWIGILISIIGAATIAFGVGFLIMIAFLVWFIVRCIKGLKYFGNQQPVPDPATWLW